MPTHMHEHSIASEKEGLRPICELIAQSFELLDPEFATEKHKMQFMRQTVLLYAWAQFSISQIVVIKFTLYRFQNTLES